MKFLVDVGVGKKVEEWLQNNGHDTRSVRDIDPRTKDSEILRIAVAEGRMVITMDKDFGELVYNSGRAHSGVMILRLEDANGDEKAKVVAKIVSEHLHRIEGKFCIYQDARLRIRK